MHYSIIRKIEKARKYAEDPSRVRIKRLEVSFRGDHGEHEVKFENGKWTCNCQFFSTWKTCSHIMTLEKLLEKMLPEEG